MRRGVSRRSLLQALPLAASALPAAFSRASPLSLGEISHRQVTVNGISLHIAELGQGPLVLLCHGWPECWYSWRHQIKAIAAAGYHVVAPDMRGFGQTEAPADIGAYSVVHNVGDMVGLVAALGERQAVIIGHDWGASVTWAAAQMRPDIFRAMAALSIPYVPRGPLAPLQGLKAAGISTYYWQYFQTPGVAEAELERNVDISVRAILYGRPVTLLMKPGAGFLVDDQPLAPLPDWLTEADIDVFVKTYKASGYRGGLNWYRNLDRNWELSGAWDSVPLSQPVLYVAGTEDIVLRSERARAVVANMAKTVPGLRKTVMIEGGGHWIQQEKPHEVNEALIGFLELFAITLGHSLQP